MAQDNKSSLAQYRPLMVIMLLIAFVLSAPSCGSDEPDMLVGYYLDIQSEIAYKASEDDEEQGTMSDHEESNVLYTTITRMQQTLRRTYPVNDYVGNDAAVISALDSIYRDYKRMYGHLEKKTVCTVKLYRTKMDGMIVKGSRSLKVYHFGILPPDVDQMVQ